MKNSEIQRIIELWLEDPSNTELVGKLEEEMKDDKRALLTFQKLVHDFQGISNTNITENPFFFSKLKFRMENQKEGKSRVQRVRWAVYAATMSASLVLGVALGSQVQSTQDTGTIITSTTEEIFAEEFLVSEYSIDNALLVEIE